MEYMVAKDHMDWILLKKDRLEINFCMVMSYEMMTNGMVYEEMRV